MFLVGLANLVPNSGLHQYLFGEYGITTVLQRSSNALAAINGAFSSPLAYNIAVAIFAIFIGLVVYVFLEGVDHMAAKTTAAIQEIEYVNDAAAKEQMEHVAGIRLGLRIITLLAWVVYLIFFARVIVPFCILVARLDSGAVVTAHNMLYVLIGALSLLVSLHTHVIFMRLLVLRPRLFGGENVIVGRGGHEE